MIFALGLLRILCCQVLEGLQDHGHDRDGLAHPGGLANIIYLVIVVDYFGAGTQVV